MTGASSNIHEIPADIRDFLREVVARRRRAAVLRAIALAITFALLWMLGWALVDRFVALQPTARVSIDLVNVVTIVVVVGVPALRLIFTRFNWLAAGHLVEQRCPELGQRLVTVTSQLLAPRELRGSSEMLARIIDETNECLRDIRPAQLAPLQSASSTWLATAAAALLVSTLLFVPWLDLPTLLGRQLRPFAGIGAVSTTRLSVEPGNVSIVQGQSLVISARAQQLGSGTITLMIAPDGQPFAPQQMTRQAGDRFTFIMTGAERDARYQVVGGDARSDVYSIRMLRRPTVLRFDVDYEYPAYLLRPPAHVTNTTGLIGAPAGSVANVHVTATEPLRGASFTIGKKRIGSTPGTQENVRVAKLPIQESATFKLELTSRQGIGMSAPFEGTVRAIPDQPPQAALQLPSNGIAVSPANVMPVPFHAQDDNGLASLVMRVQQNALPARDLPIAIVGDTRSQDGTFALDPAQFNAKPRDVMIVGIVATDSGKQTVVSDIVALYLCEGAPNASAVARAVAMRSASLLATRAAIELDQLRAQTEGARSRGEIIVPDVARLARAEESADAIVRALLRAMIHSDSPQTSMALAAMIDTAQTLSSNIAQLRAKAEQFIAPDKRAADVAIASQLARTLRESINTLWQGHQARLVLSQRQSLEAMSAAAAAASQPSTRPGTMGQLFDAVSRTMETGQRELGIDPFDANVPASLKQKIDAAAQLAAAQQPVDFIAPSQQWAAAPAEQPAFAPRLHTASMAEALRPDGKSAAARDLHLAADAARALTSAATTRPAIEDTKAYPGGLVAMLTGSDPKATADARAQMRSWAGAAQASDFTRVESDAFDADAATMAKDYSAANAADQRLAQTLAAMKPNPDLVAVQQRARTDLTRQMSDAQTIDRLLAMQHEIQARTSNAATTQQSQQVALAQSGLASEIAKLGSASTPAAQAAQRAADALSGSSPDRPAASREQLTTLAALDDASRVAIRDANLARLSTIPAMSALFRFDGIGANDNPAEIGGAGVAAPRAWSRLAWRKPGEVNTASRAPDPPGYQDALRVYFNVLGLPAQSSTEQKQ